MFPIGKEAMRGPSLAEEIRGGRNWTAPLLAEREIS
jgi:hypothetical protein